MFLRFGNATLMLFTHDYRKPIAEEFLITVQYVLEGFQALFLSLFVITFPLLVLVYTTQTVFHKNFRILLLYSIIPICAQSISQILLMVCQQGLISPDGLFLSY